MTAGLYHHPDLYDQAFAWRDYPAEVAVIRDLWGRQGRGPLHRVLELACGSAPHAPELVATGIDYLGIDLAPAMLAAARTRCPSAHLVRGDLTTPAIADHGIDLALVLLGSLYLDGPAALTGHLDAMALVVRPGGGYLLDWCVLYDEPELHADDWTVDGSAGRAHVRYRTTWHDRERGLVAERLTVRRRDLVASTTTVSWAITAPALATAVAAHPAWEQVGAWNDWDLDRPLPCAEVVRPLVWLRRV